jgi:glycosyltransferase involved in cell wall biosynthesis
MKSVAHLSTWDKAGGAAIAAWRLHQGLQGLGVESRMISRHRRWPGTDVSCIATDVHEAADLFHRRRMKPAQPAGAAMFSASPTSTRLLDHPWIAAADVVHLHWVALFVSPEDIEKLCHAGKTVFWTLHDQWAYTGGCHYIGGTRRESRDWDGSAQIDASLHPLVRMELDRKKRCFASASIQVIAPSQWMAREAAASGVFATEQIHVVPYGLDSTIFCSASVGVSAEATCDSEGEITLLFGCQSVEDRRKGYRELCDALLLCMADPRIGSAVENGRIRLKTFGRIPAENQKPPFPVTHLGTINEEEVAAILRSSSAFICPTLDDNLPNVVMESLACGCPVIGFATGGVPDMVDHGTNGILAPQGDVLALARCLTDFCLDPSLRLRLREGARATNLTNWTLEAQATRILELYDAAAPCQAAAAPGKMPDAPPLVHLEAEIHAHFATEMTRLLFAEQLSHKQEAALLRRKLRTAETRIATLTQTLEARKAAHTTLQERLHKAKSGSMVSSEEIRTLQPPVRKKTFLQRVRRFIGKRLKRITGGP